MAKYTHRRDSVQKITGSYLAPGSSYTVLVYRPGGIVTGVVGTTISLQAGHGFKAGDKFVKSDGTNFSGSNVVDSITATSIVMDGGTYSSLIAGDVLLNLAADAGTSSPLYTASDVDIYSDMGSTAINQSTSPLTSGSSGEFEYWTKQPGQWELILSGSTLVDYVAGNNVDYTGLYNVRYFGVTGDGSTDDAPYIQSAIKAAENDSAPGTVYFPPGYYLIQSTLSVTLANLRGEPGATIQAGASCTGAMIQVDTAGSMRSINTLRLDGNDNAATGIKFLLHNNFIVRDVLIYDTSTYGIHCYANKAGYKARLNLDGVETLRSSGTIASNSIGLYLQDAADAHITNCVFRDYETGCRADTQNNDFLNVHNWYNNTLTGTMKTGFYSYGGGNRFVNCNADTMSQYAYRAETDNDCFINCCAFNNGTYSLSNTAAFSFVGNSPKATVIGCRIYASSASYKFLKDIETGNSDYRYVTWLGNYKSNVTTENLADFSMKKSNVELDIQGTDNTYPVARLCATGLGNSSDTSMVDFRASADASPTSYVRHGGLIADFAADTKSIFGIFADNVPMHLRTLGAYPVHVRPNSTTTISFTSDGAIQLNEQGSTPANPTNQTQANMYMKGDKLIVHFRDGSSNNHFFYLDMTATSDQHWVYSATAV